MFNPAPLCVADEESAIAELKPLGIRAAFIYGSFVSIGHAARDIDILVLTSGRDQIERRNFPSACAVEKQANAYAVNETIMIGDIKDWTSGLFWASKFAGGVRSLMDTGSTIIGDALISIAAFVHANPTGCEGDSYVSKAMLPLAVAFPTFTGALANLLKDDRRRLVAERQYTHALQSELDGASGNLAAEDPVLDLNDIRLRFWREFAASRPLGHGGPISPFSSKFEAAESRFSGARMLLEGKLGVRATSIIEDSFAANRELCEEEGLI